MRKHILVVYGTRPEAIKLAPLVRALRADGDLRTQVVVTGQHREMLDQVHSFFRITPDVDLDLMSHGATPNAVARAVLSELERVLEAERPDAVVVQGDTTSAFAASLAAFLAGVPVVHLEAGLRTGNLRSPFPEEANRRLTGVVTSLHLAPTATARRNLELESVDPATILVTGNTVVDALQWAVQQPVAFTDERVASLGRDRPLVLVTTHRRESWGEPMQQAVAAIGDVARDHPELDVLLPLHRNSVVRDAVQPALGELPNVILTEPLAYAEFAHLMARCRLVVTDSGGVQEEAPSFGKPVLVLRDTTERPEGVEAGVVRLIGTDRQRVAHEIERLLDDPTAYAEMARAVNPYGDGEAARRSTGAIRFLLGLGPMPEPFVVADLDAPAAEPVTAQGRP
ncbi:non-hydrolyzing UDP-N-acetylglucosamine 2-epimerase [Marmoricola sp. URHB0036]|uniref:non-hydrolyzing UDP-N-acetylglucosamine 2-epimerase n=1 Tax=Marmoricola sp. URHB0036 TaxID=1298863 RepID=UPI0003F7E66C|nr:UDP-N-acetylglucosamine 2-epimerase (non-hydrolyzing) [Marmoricola sp. URHB0036]